MSENEVLIIFGTETGNAEALADDAKNRGLDVEGKKPEDVKKEIQESE